MNTLKMFLLIVQSLIDGKSPTEIFSQSPLDHNLLIPQMMEVNQIKAQTNLFRLKLKPIKILLSIVNEFRRVIKHIQKYMAVLSGQQPSFCYKMEQSPFNTFLRLNSGHRELQVHFKIVLQNFDVRRS